MRQPCAFQGLADEKPSKPNEKMYECVHGHVLTFETARNVLGLKHIARPHNAVVDEPDETEELHVP